MAVTGLESIKEAVERALSTGKPRGFRQSVELIVSLRDVDLKSPEGRLREIVYLPHGLGKDPTICVVADGDMALKARELGVRVYTREDLSGLAGDKKAAKRVGQTCDWVLVKADLMGLAGRILGPALGPRGKAPVPIPPNANIADVVNRFRRAVWVRLRNQPQVMCKVGSEDMDPREIAENIATVLGALEAKIGGHKISKVYIKRTMSPPVQLVS